MLRLLIVLPEPLIQAAALRQQLRMVPHFLSCPSESSNITSA